MYTAADGSMNRLRIAGSGLSFDCVQVMRAAHAALVKSLAADMHAIITGDMDGPGTTVGLLAPASAPPLRSPASGITRGDVAVRSGRRTPTRQAIPDSAPILISPNPYPRPDTRNRQHRSGGFVMRGLRIQVVASQSRSAPIRVVRRCPLA